MKPYIYKVIDKETHQFYIGSQCSGKTIGVNYFTSSRNKTFRTKFKTNPRLFDIEIIGTFTDKYSCVLQENIFIKTYFHEPLCLNKGYCIMKESHFRNRNNKSTFLGRHHTKEAKQKISIANKGNTSPNKGKHLSETTKCKLSKSRKGISSWNKGIKTPQCIRNKISISNKGHISSNLGKHMSKESKLKLSQSRKGFKPTEETRKKLSLVNSGVNNPFFGKQHTAESKRIMSEKKKGLIPYNKGKPQYFNRRKVICVETNVVYSSAKEAAQINNLIPNNITVCCQNSNRKTGGLHWKYY